MRGPHETSARGAAWVGLLGFFVLTFALTWTLWLAPRALAGRDLTGLFAPGGPVFLLGVFAPGIVALALTALGEGRAGVTRLLARIGRWEVGARWYLFAVSYLVLTKLVAAAIHRVIVGAWPAFGDTPLPLMFGAVLVSIWGQAGEEVGWRGYALPRLATSLGLGGASIVLGIIWALWHLPLFFLPGGGSEGQSFHVYLLFVTALSVAVSWLYWKTDGSLLLVMVMHAAVNNTTGIVATATPQPVDPLSFEGSLVAWATVGVASLVAALLLWRMRGADIGALLDAESSQNSG